MTSSTRSQAAEAVSTRGAFDASSPHLGELDEGIAVLEEIEAATRELEARRVRVLAEIDAVVRREHARCGEGGHPEQGLAFRAARAEAAAALRQSEQTTERHMEDACELDACYSATVEALASGEISYRHALVVLDAGKTIGTPGVEDTEAVAAQRRAYETRVLDLAVTTTPQRLRPTARRIAEEYATEDIETRHERVRRERRAWLQDREAGMAEVGAVLPADEAYAVWSRLTETAKRLEQFERAGAEAGAGAGAGERRSRDEIRADLFVDLLQAGVDDSQITRGQETSQGEDALSGRGVSASFVGSGACVGSCGGNASGPVGRVRGIVQVVVPVENLTGPGSTKKLIAGDPPFANSPLSSVLGTGSQAVRLQAEIPPDERSPDERLPDERLRAEGLRAERLQTERSQIRGRLAALRPPVPILNGYGPIPPSMASKIAAETPVWDRVAITPETGAVLSVDRYRPSEKMRRFIAARDQRCRFPGCRTAAHRCDIDHTVDAALGGPTSTDNLGALCRGHHTLKHHSGWSTSQHPDGSYEWTSPTGRIHVDTPEIHTFAAHRHPSRTAPKPTAPKPSARKSTARKNTARKSTVRFEACAA
ncbi:MAG: DUF222 domain-containing protein [Leucobacter sp.]